MVFKVSMKWLFIMFLSNLTFFLFKLSLLSTCLVKEGEKNKTFPKFSASRKKKKIKDIYQRLEKTRGSSMGYKAYA